MCFLGIHNHNGLMAKDNFCSALSIEMAFHCFPHKPMPLMPKGETLYPNALHRVFENWLLVHHPNVSVVHENVQEPFHFSVINTSILEKMHQGWIQLIDFRNHSDAYYTHCSLARGENPVGGQWIQQCRIPARHSSKGVKTVGGKEFQAQTKKSW